MVHQFVLRQPFQVKGKLMYKKQITFLIATISLAVVILIGGWFGGGNPNTWSQEIKEVCSIIFIIGSIANFLRFAGDKG